MIQVWGTLRIEGLLVVYPGRGEIMALGCHLLKDGFVDGWGAGLYSYSSWRGILFALWGAGCCFRKTYITLYNLCYLYDIGGQKKKRCYLVFINNSPKTRFSPQPWNKQQAFVFSTLFGLIGNSTVCSISTSDINCSVVHSKNISSQSSSW